MTVTAEARALTPEEARALLRECVTVVAPGETLVIRVPDTWTHQQHHEAQRRISEVIAERGLGFEVLLLPGEEFAVARPGPAEVKVHVSGEMPRALPELLAKAAGRAAR